MSSSHPWERLPLVHLGVAVQDLAMVLPIYKALGFECAAPEVLSREQVRAVVARKGELQLELLEPLAPGCGPIAKFLAKRGPGMHHLALGVAGPLDQELARLAAAGVRALPGYPAAGLGGTRVAFLDPKTTGGVLLELVGG